MSNDDSIRRRTFLQATGVAAASIALAGCTGNGDDDDGPDYDYIDDEPDYDGWLGSVDYDGTVDWTDESQVEIAVGADDGYRFEPPAVAISPGTEVVWEWTGSGGGHNVVEVDGAFESELVNEAGHTFEHTFDESGTYRYSCTPHEAQNMFGAIHVE